MTCCRVSTGGGAITAWEQQEESGHPPPRTTQRLAPGAQHTSSPACALQPKPETTKTRLSTLIASRFVALAARLDLPAAAAGPRRPPRVAAAQGGAHVGLGRVFVQAQAGQGEAAEPRKGQRAIYKSPAHTLSLSDNIQLSYPIRILLLSLPDSSRAAAQYSTVADNTFAPVENNTHTHRLFFVYFARKSRLVEKADAFVSELLLREIE